MEIKEAIKEFKNLKYVSKDLKVEHMELAISALEKQIPKKPTLKPITYCPHCNKVFITRNQDYCHRCGGKIDWPEVENE